MEQRRFTGKGHWYHETQTNHCRDDVLPLVPEAAHVDDRFLLDLALPTEIVTPCESWLKPARVAAIVGKILLASIGQFILAEASTMRHIRFSSCSDCSQRITSRMYGRKVSIWSEAVCSIPW